MNQLDKLSSQDFLRYLSPAYHNRLQDLIILQEVASTNDYLFSVAAPAHLQSIVCMSEEQTAGKGTKGRVWRSELGASLIYSIAYRFSEDVLNLSALSLAIGVIAQQALDDCGFSGVQLKWPNDLLHNKKKLGGVLIEVRKTSDDLHLVCGIGMNVNSLLNSEEINQPFTALDQLGNIKSVSRNEIAAKLTEGLLNLFSLYPKSGFKQWQEQWQNLHAYQDKKIRVKRNDDFTTGIARGVDEGGALLLETNLGLQTIISADVFSL